MFFVFIKKNNGSNKLDEGAISMNREDNQKQKSEWKRKGWSIPEFRGKKQEWFSIVLELIWCVQQNGPGVFR